MRPEQEVETVTHGLAPYLTAISIIAALFVGFLQLPGGLLTLLCAPALYGMRYFYPAKFRSPLSYVTNFIVVLCALAAFEWIARLASLYMTGHAFIGRVE